MAKAQQLTALKVAKLAKPGRYGDGLGLWLQVGPTGAKSWLFRFQRAGQARQMGLGPAHTVSLADARQAAQEARRLLLGGSDPIEARRTSRAREALAGAKALSFKEAAQAYIDAHSTGWKNPVHAKQWPSSLEAYAYPIIGHLPVAAIDTALVLAVLEPIWKEKPDTAGRVRGRIELVLDWSSARGQRSGENPARWRGHLDKLLPAKSRVRPTTHHPALPYREIPKFMAALRQRSGVGPRALEFTILTCARTSEAIGAKWSEFDFRAKLWTIPGIRMKAGREHRVPLSDRAISILKRLPREGEFAFIGAREGKALSNMAMLAVLKSMGREDLTVHGFRSTFRDWAAETTNFPRDVCEMALAHTVGDKVEAAYRRGDLFVKRRKLAEAWSRYCSKVAAGKST
jgi:integrase